MHSPRSPLHVHVLGNGPMAIIAAIRIATAGRALGQAPAIRVYGRSPHGGGRRRSSTPRCQMWLHRQGVIYAQTQPDVSLALQRSTRILERLAPGCARLDLPAFAIELPGSDSAAASFQALGIAHQALPPSLVQAWLPGVELPAGSKVFRTLDTTLDLPWTMHQLLQEAERQEIEFVPLNATVLETAGRRIVRIRCSDGTAQPVSAADAVVLAAGTGIRPLLAASGLALPGLRHFQSVLGAAPSPIGNRLIAVLLGGVNVVPHPTSADGLLAVFGNSRRIEVPPERDGEPLDPDPEQVELLRRDVAQQLGLEVELRASWAGVKAEIVPPQGVRSQTFHAHALPAADNGWIVIPGKLSQAVSAADELARQLYRAQLGADIARSWWETEAGLRAQAG